MMSDDAPKNQRSWLDQHFQSLIGDGNVSHLSGSGKRLTLEDESHIPETERMAHRLMRENNVLPAWMQLGRDLDEERGAILRRVSQWAQEYKGHLGDAQRASDARRLREVEAWWQGKIERVREQVYEYNRRLLTYNISLPAGIDQRVRLNADEEVQRAVSRSGTASHVPLNG